MKKPRSKSGALGRRGKKILSKIIIAGALSLVLTLLIAVSALGTGVVMRVSTDSTGAQGNDASFNSGWDPSISANGRYVAFQSFASNLVPGDSNGAEDVFLKDTTTGAITRLSTDSGGTQGNSDSYLPSISADGRYVAFFSYASNLVPGDSNGIGDIFIKDTTTGATTRVSTDSTGAQGNNGSVQPSISADGRYVAFISGASNLVPGDSNGAGDVFLKDTTTGAITRLSTDSTGAQGNDVSSSYYPSISADGRYVAFFSWASNLVPGDSNGTPDVFLKDTQSGAITRLSTDSTGAQGNNDSYYPSMSADGRYVVFYSKASNLVAGDTNGRADIFVKDTQSGAITRLSTDSGGTQGNNDSAFPFISADGRYVAFISYASNLVPGDSNGAEDVFLKDTQSGAVTRLSTDSGGAQGNGNSEYPSISADGRYVAFFSHASNLVPGDSNGAEDVFLAATDIACSGGRPPLSLSLTNHPEWKGYWASYTDYTARLLSVDFGVAGAAQGPAAYAAQITGASATGVVTLATAMPLSLGNIMPGSAHALTLKYTVQAGVVYFVTTLSASAQDACGTGYTYP